MAEELEKASVATDESGLDFEETELTLRLPGCGGGEGDRKRGFSESVRGPVSQEASGVSNKVSDARLPPSGNKAQAVGWPPVRSFWRNSTKSSCTYVKVAVDGAPYLRKVDLEKYGGYEQLLAALENMFSCFKILFTGYSLNDRKLIDPVNGTEYVPTYEDKEGDWMLVGDVPWKMFVESCKRLRLMKSSEAVNLAPECIGDRPM